MYQHSCQTAGAAGCGYKVSAGSEPELRAKIAEHASKVQGVDITDTIYNYLRDTASK